MKKNKSVNAPHNLMHRPQHELLRGASLNVSMMVPGPKTRGESSHLCR